MPWFYHFFAQAHVSMLSTCGESPRMKTSAASSRGRTSWSEDGHSKVDAVLCSIVGTCRCLEQPQLMLMQFRGGSCTSGSRGSCWCWCWCHLVFGALIVGSCMLLAVAGWCCRLARAAAQVAAAAHGGATAALQPHAASSSCGSCYRCCRLVVTPGASSRSVVVPITHTPLPARLL